MIVVDTNVIAHLLLPGEWTDAAREALLRDSAWAVPLLWRSEFCNVLALWHRHKAFSHADASTILDEALELLHGNEHAIDPAQVLKLAFNSPCSAYDCEFVALAQALRAPLVTLDQAIIKAFPGTAVHLGHFTGAGG